MGLLRRRTASDRRSTARRWRAVRCRSGYAGRSGANPRSAPMSSTPLPIGTAARVCSSPPSACAGAHQDRADRIDLHYPPLDPLATAARQRPARTGSCHRPELPLNWPLTRLSAQLTGHHRSYNPLCLATRTSSLVTISSDLGRLLHIKRCSTKLVFILRGDLSL